MLECQTRRGSPASAAAAMSRTAASAAAASCIAGGLASSVPPWKRQGWAVAPGAAVPLLASPFAPFATPASRSPRSTASRRVEWALAFNRAAARPAPRSRSSTRFRPCRPTIFHGRLLSAPFIGPSIHGARLSPTTLPPQPLALLATPTRKRSRLLLGAAVAASPTPFQILVKENATWGCCGVEASAGAPENQEMNR